MNDSTDLNTELLSAGVYGRRHIPFAVFAVILIHIVLFLVLLIAAGCRAKARAKRNLKPSPEMLGQELIRMPAAAAITTNAPLPAMPVSTEPVVATEPPVERSRPGQPVRKVAQQASPASGNRPTASNSNTRKAKIYVVQAGDTVEKIAKMHRTSVQAIKNENNLKNELIRPGQQLRVGTEKPKQSNEV